MIDGEIRTIDRSIRRRGGILLETLIALSLGVVILGASFSVLTSVLRWSRVLTGRAEALELVRTVWWVLDEELRPGVTGRDWVPVSGTALTLRAFRGVARVCSPVAGGGEWVVAYRGRRMPDPGRDSILVLGLDGGWRVSPLLSSTSHGGPECSPTSAETVLRWRWEGAVSATGPVLVRLFERGEYHLADRALRYRSGGGGRQPITPERIGTGSGFRIRDESLEVHIEFPGESGRGDLSDFTWRVTGERPESGS